MTANTFRRVTELWKNRHDHDGEDFQSQITILKTTVETQADDIIASASQCGLRTEQLVNDAAFGTVYALDQPGWYDPASKRTYFAYLGLARDLHVVYYDHETCQPSTPEFVGTYPLADSDGHGAPSICVDLDGFIHVTWGSHSTAGSPTNHQYSKSDNPWDITAWTTTDLDSDDGTYPQISVNPATGDLYVIDRVGDGTSGAFPNNKRYAGLRKSTNNGSTWSSVSQIIDSGGDLAYPFGAVWGPDGLLHIAWTFDPDTATGERTFVHHAKFEPVSGTWFTADGTSLGSDISSTEQANECRFDAVETDVGVTNISLNADGEIAVAYPADDGTVRIIVSIWNGSSWTKAEVTDEAQQDGSLWNQAHVWPVDGGWRCLAPVDDGFGADFTLFGSLDGSAWVEIGPVLIGDYEVGFVSIKPVRNHGPIVAAAQQSPSSGDSATAADLIPIWLVFDDEYTVGAGGGVTDHGALTGLGDDDHTIYSKADGTRPFTGVVSGVTPTADAHLATKGYVDGVGGSGELLMQDGVSSPPVPLETEDGTDWLYEG